MVSDSCGGLKNEVEDDAVEVWLGDTSGVAGLVCEELRLPGEDSVDSPETTIVSMRNKKLVCKILPNIQHIKLK